MSTHHTNTVGFYLVIYLVIFSTIMVTAIIAEAFFIK